MQVHLKKLRADAAECIKISSRSADQGKRELFAKLAEHLTVLADALQREIDKKTS